jgi:hypothetical protein
MADKVQKVNYAYVVVPNRAGQGAKVLGAVREAGINMLAYSGFPIEGGKAQLDMVFDRMAPLKRVAARSGWKLSRPKKAFLIQGADEVGACHRHFQKLANAGINVTAADAVTAGKGRYGMLLWVKPRDYARAAKVLGAS